MFSFVLQIKLMLQMYCYINFFLKITLHGYMMLDRVGQSLTYVFLSCNSHPILALSTFMLAALYTEKCLGFCTTREDTSNSKICLL